MKKLHAFPHPRPHLELRPITLGWTEFGIIALLLALMLLVGGVAFWPLK